MQSHFSCIAYFLIIGECYIKVTQVLDKKMAIKKNNIAAFLSWSFYEWASSAFFVIIETFVFAVYFSQKVASSKLEGDMLWGLAMGLSGLVIAFTSPIVGAIADQGGRRKLWLAVFTSLCIIATALLWTIKPSPEYTLTALILVGLGSIGSELAFVFYNAMLPDLAPAKKIGLWSGLGWSMGYAGGVICLILALTISGLPNFWTASDLLNAVPIRFTFLLAALWYFLFAIPIFLWTHVPEKKKPLIAAFPDSWKQLSASLKMIFGERYLFRFLIARMIYIDGLTSLFIFGGIYAGEAFHMDEYEILIFAIALNISAGIGAVLFSWIDDWFGSKRLIVLSLLCLIILTIGILTVHSLPLFWTLALTLGLFVGPVQASSRAYLAKIAPPELVNQMFGLFAFSGKATTFLNPLLISGTIYLTSSQTAGMSTIILFLTMGMLIMLTVPSEK